MNVSILTITADPEKLIAASARACRSDIKTSVTMNDLTYESIQGLLRIVIDSGHHSVLEHVSFTFAIDGISRVLSHQLVRHRVGIAYSQQSHRFTDVGKNFITPQSIHDNQHFKKKYDDLVMSCLCFYDELVNNNIPPEDARYIVPQSIETRLVMTVNMRQLLHMYSIDACFKSQWEIRYLMNEIRDIIMSVHPMLAAELKIKCHFLGYCPENQVCDQMYRSIKRKCDVFTDQE